MKVLLIEILKFFLRIIYAPIKLFKTKDRIVYLSRQSNDKSLDMRLLEKEIDKQIQKLKDIKTVMQRKKAKIAFCETLQEQEIRIEECKSERLLVYPYDFSKDDISEIFSHLKDIWGIEQIRMGMGSLISLDNVYKMNFDKYEGIYTIALNKKSVPNSLIKPKGKYLCGYQKGTWDKLPALYQQMLDYANKYNLQLTGYAYEVGLNDFVISDEADYITKIVIKIQEIS